MKILVTFYSRTGNTKKVAQEIADQLSCPVEEIFDTKNRSGARGYLLGGRDATLKKLTTIKPITHNPQEYDIIIIGTPVWSFNVSPAIRNYLTQSKPALKNVAFFCTMGGSGDKRTFDEMRKISAKKPLATLTMLAKEITSGGYKNKIGQFLNVVINCK